MKARFRTCVSITALAAVIATSCSSASARPGDPVDEFGQGGVSTSLVGPGSVQIPGDIAADTNGDLVVAGHSESGPQTYLAKFDGNTGSVLTNFGQAGRAVSVPGSWDTLAIQDDGRIVASGSRSGKGLIARYMPDGSIDPSFADNGYFLFDVPVYDKTAEYVGGPSVNLTELRVLTDGRIRAFGTYYECKARSSSPGCSNAMIIGLLADGERDSSLGSIAEPGVEPLGQTADSTSALILDDGGAIIVRAWASPEYGAAVNIFKLGPDGHELPGFSGNWSTDHGTVDMSHNAGAIVRDSEGRILVAVGNIVMRFGSDGEFDEEFSKSGPYGPGGDLAWFMGGYAWYYITDISMDPSGRLLTTGDLVPGSPEGKARYNGAIGRLTAGIQGDPTFSGDGISMPWSGNSRGVSEGSKVVRLPDGSVVATGTGQDGPFTEVSLAKLAGGEDEIPDCQGKPANFIGDAASERVSGQAGDVIVTRGGDDRISAHGSTVCSGSGDDTVTLDGPASRVSAGSGDDIVKGGPSTDRIVGGPGDDRLLGAGQSDFIRGDEGSDLIKGGARDDRLYGGSGRDRIFGEIGFDQLVGGPGSDLLAVGPTGPRVTEYLTDAAFGRLRIIRTGNEAEAKVNAKLECQNAFGYTPSGRKRMGPIKVDPGSGKFRYRSDPGWRDWQGQISYIEDIEGEFRRNSVSGRYRIIDSDHATDNYTCWSGKSFENPWVEFRAMKQPEPQQFAKQ